MNPTESKQPQPGLTHLNQSGEAHMVDVTDKLVTEREARAEAFVAMAPDTLALILSGQHHKGTCSPPPASPASWRPRRPRISFPSAIRWH